MQIIGTKRKYNVSILTTEEILVTFYDGQTTSVAVFPPDTPLTVADLDNFSGWKAYS